MPKLNIPADAEENHNKLPDGAAMNSNANKEAMVTLLGNVREFIKNSDQLLDSLVVLTSHHDESDEDRKKEAYEVSISGSSMTAIDSAMRFIGYQTNKMIDDNMPDATLDERVAQRQGLGLAIIHELVEEFELTGENVNLNALKQSYEDAMKTDNVKDTEVTNDEK